MTRTYSLNGPWELTYTALGQPEAWGRWIPAVVPGDIHLDLKRAGLIAEPLAGDNSKKHSWIEDKNWWYRKVFKLDDVSGERLELVCEGLDLTADLWLNGHKVGSANNMFIAHRFDLTDYIKSGENELRVRLDVGFEAVRDAPVEKFAKAWGRDEPRRPWLRKAQQSFYWDTAPRLVTCGIWRDVYLERHAEVTLRDVYVSSSMSEHSVKPVSATLTVSAEVEAFAGGDYLLEVTVKDKSTDLSKQHVVGLGKGMNKRDLELELAYPQLWWPNGMGAQHLYDVTVRLTDADGKKAFGEKSFKHGVRHITIEQLPLNDKEKTFTVVVNGAQVFCKGGNWVPPDSIYARISPETEYKLLKYAADANFNMMRVWGGGIYPSDDFYNYCDDMGIMVWQDFMYACAYYPDDEPEFCSVAKHEAELIVRRYRNHASLALWCGNNETYMMHARVDPEGIFYGHKIFSEILPEVCARLQPAAYYHPSSPFPRFWRPGVEEQGDQHIWSYTLGWLQASQGVDVSFSPEEEATAMKLWDYPELNLKFLSEFGVYGPSNLSSIQKFMGEHPLVVGSEVYQHHRNHFEADFILEMLRRYYKARPEYSLEEFIVAGQMSQAEVVKYILEELRSRMYVCSGTLFWEYNDSWGHVGYAPVDYYLNVKPLYHYMRRAFAPLHAVFKRSGEELYILNDTLADRHLDLEYGVMTFRGDPVFAERKTVAAPACGKILAADMSERLATLSNKRAAFAFVRVFENGTQIDRNRQFLAPVQDLVVPDSTLEHTVTRTAKTTWQVKLKARHFAWMVKLDAEDDLLYADNAFDLWPGEEKTVEVSAEREVQLLRLKVVDVNRFVNS